MTKLLFQVGEVRLMRNNQHVAALLNQLVKGILERNWLTCCCKPCILSKSLVKSRRWVLMGFARFGMIYLSDHVCVAVRITLELELELELD